MLILRLFIVILSGIAAHQGYEPTKIFGARWGSLMRYAIGILLFIPAFIVVKPSIPEKQGFWGDVERDLTAGLLTAGATGTGVIIGHILDKDDDNS